MTTPNTLAERHLLVTIRGQPAQRPRVQQLLLELIDPIRSEPGCLYYHLFAHADDPNAFVLVAGWVNDEALAAHPTHPAVPGVLALLRPLLAGPWEMLPTRRVIGNSA